MFYFVVQYDSFLGLRFEHSNYSNSLRSEVIKDQTSLGLNTKDFIKEYLLPLSQFMNNPTFFLCRCYLNELPHSRVCLLPRITQPFLAIYESRRFVLNDSMSRKGSIICIVDCSLIGQGIGLFRRHDFTNFKFIFWSIFYLLHDVLSGTALFRMLIFVITVSF